MAAEPLLGKFRGVVVDIDDPDELGRIRARVPALSAAVLNWAMPCVPYAGNLVGLAPCPPVGASVWIEFERGDPDYPIWAGCFWETGQKPDPGGEAGNRPPLHVATARCTLTIDDQTPSLQLVLRPEQGTATSITVGGEALTITRGTDSLKVTSGSIALTTEGAGVTVAGTVTATSGSGRLAVGDTVSLTNGETSVSVTAQSVALTGGAASAQVGPATVALNGEALVVLP
jgi:uncharacterized protein involved in type VI secretion and phage assembly